MKMSGRRQLDASREEVWAKLNDPEVLQRSIPGCQSLEMVGENQLHAVVQVKVGPISAKFEGDVELSDLNPPESYRISGSGRGGAAGSASGGADVVLQEADGGTELSYDVDAQVKGKIAQLGGRLIDATAASLANQFFDNFAKEFAPPDDHAVATDKSGPERATSPAQSGSSVVQGALLLAGAVLLLALGWYLFF